MSELLQWIVSGLMTGIIYALVAAGFVLVYKATGVFNIAQGEMVMLGGFFLYFTVLELGWPIALSVPISLVAAGVLGLVIQRLFIRPMIGQPVFSSFMVTIALAMLIRSVVIIKWGAQSPGIIHIFPQGSLELGGVSLVLPRLLSSLIALFGFAALFLFFRYAKVGLLMRATSEDHQLAESAGISVRNIVAISWVIAFVLALGGGVVLSSIVGVGYSVADLGLVALPVAIFGGLESLGGVLLSGLIVGVVQYLAMGYLDPLTEGGMGTMMPYIMMLLILLVRPHGLFGWKRIERV